jgi:hypothetical protein
MRTRIAHDGVAEPEEDWLRREMNVKSQIIVATLLATLSLTGMSYAAEAPGAGIYSDTDLGHGQAALKLNNAGRGTLNYRTKTECDKLAGRIRVKFEGKRFEAAHGHVSAVGKLLNKNTIVIRLNAEQDGCKGKASFILHKYKPPPPPPPLIAAHYAGSARDGSLVSFDLVEEHGRLFANNLSLQQYVDCDDESSTDPLVLVHLDGLRGHLDESNELIYSYSTPNNYVEYSVFGEVTANRAQLRISVQGFWNADGSAASEGTGTYCSSTGATYVTHPVG